MGELMCLVILASVPLPAFALIDDRAITLRTPADISAKRAALIHFIWGPDGWLFDGSTWTSRGGWFD